jgi:hypothetical protein
MCPEGVLVEWKYTFIYPQLWVGYRSILNLVLERKLTY